MSNEKSVLFENKGVWYFHGAALRIGGSVTIEGVVWSVLGIGRSRSENQTPFLWIRNENYGITVYAPSLVEHKPRLKIYLKEETPIDLCMTAA